MTGRSLKDLGAKFKGGVQACDRLMVSLEPLIEKFVVENKCRPTLSSLRSVDPQGGLMGRQKHAVKRE